MIYLLDTNIFITSKNFLPMDVYPSFWGILNELANSGIFKSIKKVEEELRKGNDEIVPWIENELPKDFFMKEDINTLTSLSIVSQWANTKDYTQAAKNTFVSTADSWIIAEALSKSCKIITHEVPDPMSKKRVKIPDVCNGIGVPYCSLNDAFREEGIRI